MWMTSQVVRDEKVNLIWKFEIIWDAYTFYTARESLKPNDPQGLLDANVGRYLSLFLHFVDPGYLSSTQHETQTDTWHEVCDWYEDYMI